MWDKIKELVKKVGLWIWQSSANPQAVSLTVKSALLGAVTYVVVISNVFGLQNLAGNYSEIVGGVVKLVEATLGIVASVGVLVGASRKIYITVKKVLAK